MLVTIKDSLFCTSFVPSLKMTVLSNDNKIGYLIAISALKTAGVKPVAIAKQLGLKYETVKKHMQRKKLLAGLPPILWWPRFCSEKNMK